MSTSNWIAAPLKNAERHNAVVEGDYIGENGLWFCGKCHTPKQHRIQIFQETITPFVLCQCAIEREQREKQKNEAKKQEERISVLRNRAFINKAKMKNWTFANALHPDSRVLSIAMNYVQNFSQMKDSGKGLLFFGDTSVGKSYAAACIVNALIEQGIPCLVTDFRSISNHISANFNEQENYFDELSQCPLLFIDDFSAERDTSYMNEIVYTVINNRCLSGLPLIVTTNLTDTELRNPTEISQKRVFERLLEICIPVRTEGNNQRAKILRDDFERFGKDLGLKP